MTLFPTRRHSILAAAVAAVLALGAIVPAQAQTASDRAAERRAERDAKKKRSDGTEQQFPAATRTPPEVKGSAKARPKLEKMIKLYDDDKGDEARVVADEIIANEAFNAYDHAFAAQLASQAAYNAGDEAAAIAYMRKAVELNALDNNNHFNAMLMLSQVQMQEEGSLAEGLATLERFLTESGSTKPDHLAMKGQALYQLEKYPEAAAVFKQLVDSNPEPKDQWLSLLMSSNAEMGKTDEAIALAEKIAAKAPDDKKKQMNLAAVYSQADKFDKAAVILEKMRAAGQLTEDRDYKILYSTYLNMEGREKEVATIINDGLAKGILKPDYQTYLAMAQSYYFSDQIAPAIDAYRKAAPLSTDGETYLNLARLLWQEDRIPEAKEAAKQAIAKGLKKPDDAKKILALPAK
ncbi:tetratricopeptide repeat protein [Agrilutibacter solisilvae]|uniref:Tetratricopeptide repeat protein n=1 Tax=Agrilutibacter solisilvae TaxID=2763317 RepID=A0A974Y0S9_9GAMM|nr:tetratricopeptide repeat protein [Lysobacter solisilvae]QSX79168.1 tetratricopeptide repeat protein [Lysobacter solisilvae]